jgi:hypothetical protein
MSDIARWLADMFEADRDMPADEWFERFRLYRHDWELGAKPWWPPLSEVWRLEGQPPEDMSPALCMTQAWPEAWALLQRVHAEYLDAKARKAGGSGARERGANGRD